MTATETLRRLNPRIFLAQESPEVLCAIEDVYDPFGRAYRIEYQTTLDGSHALAYCRHNPWGNPPNAGITPEDGRVAPDGLLLLDAADLGGATRNVREATRPLDQVIVRARYWCCNFSGLIDAGHLQPTPQAAAPQN